MDTNQPAPQPVYLPASAAPGMFGTKIPAMVAFIIAVLLFFMPFVDIKCNGTSLQTISGLQLATGFNMKNNNSTSWLNDTKTDNTESTDSTATSSTGSTTKTTTKTDKKDPNIYALAAAGLAILGLFLTFSSAKAAMGAAMISGIASAGTLIGLMLDIKKKAKLDMPASTSKSGSSDALGLDKLGDNMKITIDFTPWFYIAVIALLAAAFFCYKRMSAAKT